MAALTRILNNQIYNSTIIGYQKIAAGTITGSLFASNVTVPGDLLIAGNLFVLGSSAYTTIASTNTYVNDPLVVLNNGFSGSNSRDEGLVFNRGTDQNQAFIWSEANKEFQFIGTTETGTTYGAVTASNFANLHVGNLGVNYNITVGTLTVNTAITSSSLNLSGNLLASTSIAQLHTGSTATFGNVAAVTVGNVGTQFNGAAINLSGNVLAAAGVFNTLTVNGNETVTGYINAAGNIGTPQLNAGQINTTGNVLATAGVFNALTVNGNETISGYINAAGNISTPQLNAGQINTTGNVLATAGTFNALTVNGNESVTGYLNVTGNVLGAAATFSSVLSNGVINTTGNVLATAGVFNALTVNGNESVTGYLNVTGNVLTASLSAGQINTTGNVLATAGTFNALTVNGNESVTGYLNVTGNILGDTGTLSVLNVNNTLWANSSAGTTTQGTGALIIPTGGISVAGAANIAGATTIGGATQLNNTLTVGGIEYITNTTNATEATGSSGALQIKGGVSIAKDLHIGGNIYAANIFSTTYQILTIQDPLVYFDAANTYPYNYDIGFYSNFVGPNPIDNTGNAYQHSGVVRDNADNTWKFFSNVRTEPSGAAITFDTNTIYDPVKAGNLVLTYTQAATSTTTGALQVAGGAGIVGTVVAGQINSTGNVLGQAGTFNALTVNGNESVTGYLNVTGNVMAAIVTASQLNTTGNVVAQNGILNGLTVNGNESVTGYLNVTGNVLGAAATFSSATVNGLINATGNIISTGAIHNSLTVNGNGSVTGYLNVTGNVLGAAATFSSATVNGLINTSGNVLAAGGVFSGLTVNGNESITGYLNVTGNVLTTRLDTGTIGATGVIYANSTAKTTTSTGTGAIVVPTGGASVFGNVYIGEKLFIGPNTAEVAGTSTFSGLVINSVGSNQSFVQIALGNNDNRGSTDYAAYASDGSDAGGWVDMGFTGNAFSDANYTITKSHDGYLFARAQSTFGGNLVLATSEAGVYNDIVLGVGSFLDTAEVARFHGNVGTSGNAWIKYQTVSTTPNNGALRVDGGVGVRGNLRVGGGAVINNSQTADPFQVKGVATTSLIYADTAYSAVVIGGSNVAPQLGSTLKINGTDSLLLPIGSTGQRPGATGNIDIAGMIRFNTTIQNMEFYDGSQWQTAGSVFTVISDRQFTGNIGGGYGNVDGTNKVFTIQSNSTTSGTIVSINGVIQFPTLAYDVSGTTLTFTEAPAPDDVIDVRVLATTSTIGALANGNGLNQVVAGNDGVQIWTGTSSTTERVLFNQVGDVNLLDNNKLTYNQTAVNITANNTPYVIATFSTSSYTSAKYLISAKKDATNVQTMEAVVVTDGSNAYLTTYGVVNNGTSMGGLTANVVGGNVQIYFTTTTNMTNANVKTLGTYIV